MRPIIAALLLLVLRGNVCFAEDAAPAKFYKLDFVVKEVEAAKVLNSRTYSMIVSTVQAPGSVRTGSRVPYSTGEKTTFMDVGVNIDCRSVKEAFGGLSLRVDANISSVAQESSPPPTAPVIRQNAWASDVIVPVKKPTVIFSSDDLTGKHQMQLELTATPIL